MSIVRYRPADLWQEMRHFFDQLPESKAMLTDGSVVETGDWTPAVDIHENENNFIIHADLPGIDKENIEVSMENNTLTIKGKRNQFHEKKHKDYVRSERIMGRFYRRFTLPETADGENITAKTEKGVLEVTIPKKEIAKPRSIAVSGD